MGCRDGRHEFSTRHCLNAEASAEVRARQMLHMAGVSLFVASVFWQPQKEEIGKYDPTGKPNNDKTLFQKKTQLSV